MVGSFADKGTEDLFNGLNSSAARKCCPHQLHATARRRLELLDSVTLLEELRIPPGNRLESLLGDREGQHSIRINQRYRICFKWTAEGPSNVEIVDYH
ncbi:MAG: type II toxin-antitoxin system RelE/ParE family toxin [Planctomycetes bacterium]|nr:type II toxin-antitoxin system RelE/ParE family toxin [Planctomycetota bacterium]